MSSGRARARTFDEQVRAEVERFDHIDLRQVRREVHRHPCDHLEKVRVGRDAGEMANVHCGERARLPTRRAFAADLRVACRTHEIMM